jgi:hypothetical protein
LDLGIIILFDDRVRSAGSVEVRGVSAVELTTNTDSAARKPLFPPVPGERLQRYVQCSANAAAIAPAAEFSVTNTAVPAPRQRLSETAEHCTRLP